MTPQEKLNKIIKYIKNELIAINKVIDKIMQGAEPVTPEPDLIPPIPTPDPPDDIPVLKTGYEGYYNFRPKEIKLFKFSAKVSNPECPIGVSNTPMPKQRHTVHLLIKRGGKPTIAEVGPSMFVVNG